MVQRQRRRLYGPPPVMVTARRCIRRNRRSRSSSRHHCLLPPSLATPPTADGSAAVHHQSCGEEDDQDDEQVERFYVLLANIRALRGLYSAGTRPAASGRGSSKRARETETAPWTPAFRLEDFEEEVNQGAAARCAVMNQGASGGVARWPAAAAATADDDHADDGVAEVARGGSKLGRRVAARG